MRNLLTQRTVFGSALSISHTSVLKSFMRMRIQINVEIGMPELLNSSSAELSASAIGIYVTVRLFTTDVYMLHLKNISRPEFEHTLILFLLLCENTFHLSTFALRQNVFWLTLPFYNQPHSVIFFIVSSRLPFASQNEF